MDSYKQLVRELEKKVANAESERDLAVLALENLTDRYLRNRDTEHEFVACLTPNGPMAEWEVAKMVINKIKYDKRGK